MISYLEDHLKPFLIGLVCLVLLTGCGLFLYGKLGRYEDTLVVRSLDWRRTLTVEVYKTLHEDTLAYHVPPDAFNVRRYTRHWSDYHHQTCGVGKNEHDCSYWTDESEDRAAYDVNRWVHDHDLVTAGDVDMRLFWAVFMADPIQILGAQREGARREQFFVHFDREAKPEFVYEIGQVAVWKGYYPGQVYRIAVNRMEEPIWDTIQLVNRQ